MGANKTTERRIAIGSAVGPMVAFVIRLQRGEGYYFPRYPPGSDRSQFGTFQVATPLPDETTTGVPSRKPEHPRRSLLRFRSELEYSELATHDPWELEIGDELRHLMMHPGDSMICGFWARGVPNYQGQYDP